ncbi:cyclic nucleotide-binding domain-containing protein [Amycolatopsis mongoliensis]|uniref:Cyclic nucleotide-binding domain-containing protein n=1 Tax=Amycolatopsis mongoliensis TaxID=715475 RepID=A0A9Y2NJS4_9PSEU|nr:cyclic nucleotide-binding domain-containing protein [Amycolatopsis sp. 4-36]WIY00405.1 cyclic nucleotide-binding domain-containing protein [Amycolatopsis sp. 4-36]
MSAVDRFTALPPFSRLTPAETALLTRATREVAFAPGERLCEEGRPADRLWVLESGRVEVDTAVPGRGDVVVQALGPGELLGWSWLVPPYRWDFGARAVTTVTAAELDGRLLRELADEDPAFGYALTRALFEVLAHRLRGTRARLLDLYRSGRD